MRSPEKIILYSFFYLNCSIGQEFVAITKAMNPSIKKRWKHAREDTITSFMLSIGFKACSKYLV